MIDSGVLRWSVSAFGKHPRHIPLLTLFSDIVPHLSQGVVGQYHWLPLYFAIWRGDGVFMGLHPRHLPSLTLFSYTVPQLLHGVVGQYHTLLLFIAIWRGEGVALRVLQY